MRGLELVGLARGEDVYWTLRTTLVARREELEPFDRAFRAWFLGDAIAPPARPRDDPRRPRRGSSRTRREGHVAETPPGEEPERLGWSAHEVLRRKDFAAMTPGEAAAARRLIAEIACARPQRSSRRLRPHRRGRTLDVRRLARDSLATGGDPLQRRFRRRVQSAPQAGSPLRRLGLDGGLHPGDAALPARSRALRPRCRGLRIRHPPDALDRGAATRDPEQALRRAAGRVVDWAGGTRIGSVAEGFQRRLGAAGADARGGRARGLRRLGAGRRAWSAREMQRLLAPRTPSSGPTP